MRFARRTFVRASAKALYEWHMRPGAFERLTPPWEDVRILERHGTPDEPGYRAVLSMPLGPWRVRWVAEHRSVEPGVSFVDEQLHGPFHRWEHTHRFREYGSRSVLEDEVEFELPFGWLGQTLGTRGVLRSLERVFRYGHATTVSDIETHLRYRRIPRMKFLVTEASGLVGSTLCPFLTASGHEVVRLLRGRNGVPAPGEGFSWDPLGDSMDPALFAGVDAVVHSAGRKTRLLSQALAKLEKRPRVMLNVSTVRFYGDRGASLLDESSTQGSGLRAEACANEERATERAVQAGIRVVHLRTGLVLNARGGVPEDTLAALRLGL
jgi:ligand-binding SRPBCC domain-containing protein